MMGILIIFLWAGMFTLGANSEILEDPPVKLEVFRPYIHSGEEDLFEQRLITLLEEYQVAGLSAAVVNKEKVLWSGSFGWFELSEMIPLKEDHLMRIASISKSFVCLSAMQLVSEGRLDLDEDINVYLNRIESFIRHPDYPEIPITTRQLMNHTSGIANGNYVPFVVAAREEDPPPTLDDYFSEDGRFNEPIIWSNFAPGEEFEYSNMATIVLGAVIESITGQLFADYVDKAVFQPLKMKNSSFHINEGNIDKIGTMYRRRNTNPVHFTRTDLAPLPEWDHYIPGTHGGLHSPQGGMISNALDLARFVRLMINHGTLDEKEFFSSDIIRLMHEVSVETDKGGSATFGGLYRKKGLGIHITDQFLEGYRMYGHLGGAYGISTDMYYTINRENDFGIILLINGANSVVNGLRSPYSRLVEELADLLYDHFIRSPVTCSNITDK